MTYLTLEHGETLQLFSKKSWNNPRAFGIACQILKSTEPIDTSPRGKKGLRILWASLFLL